MALQVVVKTVKEKREREGSDLEKQLIKYLKNFSILDLIGAANIVGAKEPELTNDAEDDFINFMAEIIEKFCRLPRKERKAFLKMAKHISEDNAIEFKKQGLPSNGAISHRIEVK